ncbi:MAG: SGNH/GDSL hydrolase family protein [Candidatus Korobacteraceae bacterium]
MRYLTSIGRCCLGLVIFAIVLEVCARVDDVVTYGAPFWGSYNDEILLQRDSIGKWGKPGARYAKWQLNSLGYRGPELRAGSVRIITMGASETFGLYEAPGEEYPRQLERDLNSWAGKDLFQVVNVAFAGETLPTTILRVPQIVEQIHPSCALIYPDLSSYIWMSLRSASNSPAPDVGEHRKRFESRLSGRIENLLKQTLPTAIQDQLWKISMRREIASRHYVILDRLPDERFERFRQDLRALITALRDREVEPILVTHATIFSKPHTEGDRISLTHWRKIYPMLREEGFLDMENRMNDVIRQTAAEEHLPLIDADKEMPHGPKNFADFVHFTTYGAGVMAAILANGMEPVLNSQLQAAKALTPTGPAVQLPSAGSAER